MNACKQEKRIDGIGDFDSWESKYVHGPQAVYDVWQFCWCFRFSERENRFCLDFVSFDFICQSIKSHSSAIANIFSKKTFFSLLRKGKIKDLHFTFVSSDRTLVQFYGKILWCLFKNGPFLASFSFFALSLELNINFADDWIRTTYLWCCKRPLYQLSHNHFPIMVFYCKNV